MLKEQIDRDIKTALLGGDKARAEVLRSLKSAILYEEVAKNARDTGLPEETVLTVITREAKKRSESAQIYEKAGAHDRAKAEQSERKIIQTYLPSQLSDEELVAIVDKVIAAAPDAQFGQIIGQVKQKVGAQADGGRIAAIVKAKLQA